MPTQLNSEAGDPARPAQEPSNRPAFNDAGIWVKSDGRQLKISTGEDPEADELNVHPNHEEKADSSAPAMEVDPPTPQGEEQKITRFSEDQQRRCRDFVHSMRRDADGLFVTLTYHETDPHPRTAKKHLRTWWKRMRRRFPVAGMIWKMEAQKRGTVHFHVLVYGVDFIPIERLTAHWHEVTEETSEAHLKAGVDLEPVINENGKIQSYLTKYFSKDEEECPWEDPGRFWGAMDRKNLPRAKWDDAPVHLHRSDAQRLIGELLDEWDSDVPDGVIPPSLTINTRGDPTEVLEDLLSRL